MNFEDYEREQYARYTEFSETVAHVLSKAIEASGIPRPQSIQHRAKSPKSLKARLEESGKLASDTIEADRRDLAGVRVIFYTNTDVDRFLNSQIIAENFEIERDATRVHHPTAENADRRYRAIHYTIRLKDDRAKLAEYAKFNGMRCEIQIHTILNHAWSETSHDIAYKNKPREGFGTKAMEEINNRLNRVMDRYLLPAGYEFQRVQHDYERLQEGKELFDRDILDALGRAKDNNERFELITSLKEHISNYDDVPALFGDLVEPLLSAATKAKDSPPTPITTPFGDLPGKTAENVARLVVELFDMLRYVDVARTFDALCKIYLGHEDEQTRRDVEKAVEHLARYDLGVWQKVGPAAQSIIADTVEHMTTADKEGARALVAKAWESLLRAEVTGTTWHANSVSLNRGAVPVTPEIIRIRSKAIAGLFDLFKSATSDDQRRVVLNALHDATRAEAHSSNEFRKLTITDGIRIVDFFESEANNLSYELREAIEYHYLFEYHRAQELADDEADKFGCRTAAKSLMDSIIRFRDRINADDQFVRYKTLVGFEIVLPEHWNDEDRDFRKVEEFRKAEAERYIDSIAPENEIEWFAFIERCAATKSNDGATFPIFMTFLTSLASRKPEVTKRLLNSASTNLLHFLAPVLDGLYKSDRTIWREVVDANLSASTNLDAIVRHWRSSKLVEPKLIKKILESAIASEDDQAVQQCILYAMETGPGNGVPPNGEFFGPALNYAKRKNITSWIRGAWFAHNTLPFLAALTDDEAKALLDAMLDVPKIEFNVERMLCQIASAYRGLVWEFFGQRLKHKRDRDGDFRYDAVPYQFHGLEKELSKDAPLAVSIVRGWYGEDSALFRFLGGRLLSTAFPKFVSGIAATLETLVTSGTSTDADFVLAVIENYHGEAETHEVLKRIVAKYPKDRDKLSGVSASLGNTGVVHGEFGFVDAIRAKKLIVEPWLADRREEVRAFAAEYMRQSDIEIADEQRRAEGRKALRELQYDEGEDGLASPSTSDAESEARPALAPVDVTPMRLSDLAFRSSIQYPTDEFAVLADHDLTVWKHGDGTYSIYQMGNGIWNNLDPVGAQAVLFECVGYATSRDDET
jgi:ppGpp synthetase/RelA/SpoT-type nucleotidyltranferase